MAEKRARKRATKTSENNGEQGLTIGGAVDAVVDPAKVTLENLARLVMNHHDILKHNSDNGVILLPPSESK